MTTDTTGTTTDVSRIDAPYKASGVDNIEVEPGQGVLMKTLPQMIEAAKLMAKADIALPPHARNRPEICFAVMMRTENWKLRDPFFVAEHSYVVTQKRQVNGRWEDIDSLAYDSAVYQAALLASGAIIGRPNYYYEGDGDERRCTVEVRDRQTGELHSMVSPPLRLIHPGHTEKGYVRGSPLWDRNPDQQLGYHTLRNLVRLKFQDVLSGFYDKDEFAEYPELGESEPPSPNLLERLPGRIEGEGFKPTHGEEARQEQAALSEAEAKQRARKEALKAGWVKRKANAAKKAAAEPQEAVAGPEAKAASKPEPAPAATAAPAPGTPSERAAK